MALTSFKMQYERAAADQTLLVLKVLKVVDLRADKHRRRLLVPRSGYLE